MITAFLETCHDGGFRDRARLRLDPDRFTTPFPAADMLLGLLARHIENAVMDPIGPIEALARKDVRFRFLDARPGWVDVDRTAHAPSPGDLRIRIEGRWAGWEERHGQVFLDGRPVCAVSAFKPCAHSDTPWPETGPLFQRGQCLAQDPGARAIQRRGAALLAGALEAGFAHGNEIARASLSVDHARLLGYLAGLILPQAHTTDTASPPLALARATAFQFLEFEFEAITIPERSWTPKAWRRGPVFARARRRLDPALLDAGRAIGENLLGLNQPQVLTALLHARTRLCPDAPIPDSFLGRTPGPLSAHERARLNRGLAHLSERLARFAAA